ncbi:putative lipid-binding protein AIR1 [Raphanus sativus]|uniref:Lipid-binding protein AIR1 n=1 Tax=Raphanus sativus TaxID=3726 RepID=A0A6J0LPD7_RAPSA|nr:putative lipid-binding protein AIR1 [Raphanus sativus]XP_056847959.1 putative lipid-binding protein AIR1 [Raphanus sativus]XP_056848007.1 putative lipid-binding protein AIR1 [Raphanus sativus]KAJ4909851.1 putative lipid-binding protein AIR1 [Raphanus sativus]KAJ4909853.1 putative lipid-binding protein AIR1 [Raphanus sativus]KAJ4909854.1 putative lipid-binding protein AIR1 [Raphanus sativus]
MAPRIALALFLSLNFLFFTHTSALGTCPRDTLQIGLCANALNVVNIILGYSPVKPCCSLIDGLVDLEAAACLCTALKVNILGIKLNLPIYVNALLNNCGHITPTLYPCV